MVGLSFVDIITVVSGILVAVAAVMTFVLWREEGRRSSQHTRAQARHTALGSDDEHEDAQVSA